jgi:hypothetical protein
MNRLTKIAVTCALSFAFAGTTPHAADRSPLGVPDSLQRDALHPAIGVARPSAGLQSTLARVSGLLEGSGAEARALQDPLSFRTLAQLHGATRDAFGFVTRLVHVVAHLRQIQIAKVHVHLFKAVIELPFVIEHSHSKRPVLLRRIVFREFRRDFYFFAFAQQREVDGGAFVETANKLRQLSRLEQNLIVQHAHDVILLNPGRRRRTVRHHVIDHQSEAFWKPELFTDNSRHRRCFHAQERDRLFWAIITRGSRRTRRNRRRDVFALSFWRCGWTGRLREHRNWRQGRNDEDNNGFCFHSVKD